MSNMMVKGGKKIGIHEKASQLWLSPFRAMKIPVGLHFRSDGGIWQVFQGGSFSGPGPEDDSAGLDIVGFC